MGKSIEEGLGEVQEMIDICDFAVGQSRQLYGYSMQSERPEHRMYDQYHPLGVVGIVSAFNFPVAVWSWNAMLAAVCGNANLWKPSSKAPLSAIAVQHILADVLRDNADVIPEGLFSLVVGSGRAIGARASDSLRTTAAPSRRSELDRLALLADSTKLLNFGNVLCGQRYFAGRVTHIDGNDANLLRGGLSLFQQRFHVRTDTDHEVVHRVADAIGRCINSIDDLIQ